MRKVILDSFNSLNHMSLPDQVFVDAEVASTPLTTRVLDKLPDVPVKFLNDNQEIISENISADRTILYLKNYRGKFLRPCPATKIYRCCAYQIIHIGENCPLNCSYCILQAYFQDRILKVWANQDHLWSELDQAFSRPKQRFRVGTGEFTDSLALEHLTEYSADLIRFINDYPNVRLELKSKVINLSWMDQAHMPEKILPAWSVNSPDIIAAEEKGASSLEERLIAARTCADQGFRVCLHFDPIIHYPGWERGYARTIEMIFDHLQAKQIAYVSLGSFRFMPWLKKIIAVNHPSSSYIYNEYITGMDGKTRLLLPLRIAQFRFIAQGLKQGGMSDQIYFCMESDNVWKSVLGYTPDRYGGLGRHLMKLSFQ
ncbi:SPL family radical SAM protein [Desulfonatronovibrio magnus]|uniref:SPL family radical SAM protein n=1 Tax=Desulfonatronovibrio magnus TaxID=698827 RepID=UPI000B08EAF5|nr:radical SAM protein [Desulfonatronovibrio magnus]RQD56937.1 MAG: radical SAM protein [Desulfonatronovibrio sp. MSAO_Bac4]